MVILLLLRQCQPWVSQTEEQKTTFEGSQAGQAPVGRRDASGASRPVGSLHFPGLSEQRAFSPLKRWLGGEALRQVSAVANAKMISKYTVGYVTAEEKTFGLLLFSLFLCVFFVKVPRPFSWYITTSGAASHCSWAALTMSALVFDFFYLYFFFLF